MKVNTFEKYQFWCKRKQILAKFNLHKNYEQIVNRCYSCFERHFERHFLREAFRCSEVVDSFLKNPSQEKIEN